MDISKATAQASLPEPEIVVVHDDVAAFWDRNSAWQATFGDYDLDCLTGTGHTPLDAIVDLLDKAEC